MASPATDGMGTAGAAVGREREPLRVGLLLDGWRVPAWVHAVVEDVMASPHGMVVLVVLRRDPAPRPGFLRRLVQRRNHLLYALYSRLDRRWFRRRPDAFARRDLAPLLDSVPVLETTPRTTRFSDHLEDADLEAIRDHRPDVLLRFGFRILRGGVLTVAPHGVWSYHHDDEREIRGGPPGFWEVMEGRPGSGAILQVLGEALDAGRVLVRSVSPTDRRSVIRNRNHVYWTAVPFVRRSLEHLATTGRLPSPPGEEPGDGRGKAGPLYRKPGNLRAAAVLGRFALRAGADWAADRFSRRPWFLAYGFDAHGGGGPESTGTEGKEGAELVPDLRRFTPLLPPPDRFWADPFPLRRDGRWWVFFEEYRFAEGRGHLRALELDPEAGASPSVPVLEAPFHLSHPVLFEWEGELYLLPEAATTGQVRAWRCTGFPGRWEPGPVLLEDVAGLDPTLHREGDRWWLFANLAPPGASHGHDALHLFHAPSPLGPWEPVAENPVKVDARSARPAGSLFRWRGDLYRPGQDCGPRYGHAIVLHRVRRLDPEGYREEAVERIEPRWFPGLLATHTINRDGPLVVVDGMRRRWPLGRRAAERRHRAV